jgi:Tfp pilus assembly protein PilO
MHDDIGLWKWVVQHVAIPLLGGLWAALGWWVKMISDKFARLEDTHKEEMAEIHARITASDQRNADRYATQDYVREGFGRIEGKLDLLVKHALKDAQG